MQSIFKRSEFTASKYLEAHNILRGDQKVYVHMTSVL